VIKPGEGNYNTYVGEKSMMHDIDSRDWDRWCEYILYKDIKRVGYARVSRGTITDTEIQVCSSLPSFRTLLIQDRSASSLLASQSRTAMNGYQRSKSHLVEGSQRCSVEKAYEGTDIMSSTSHGIMLEYVKYVD
jgi:hypothetical protein